MKERTNINIEISKCFKEKLNEISAFHNNFFNKIKNQIVSCHENYCIIERNNFDMAISKSI